MANVNDLNVVTRAFLDAAVAALSLTEAGPPLRYYVAPGEPALDCCGQLTVWAQTLSEADLFAGGGALAPMKKLSRGMQPLVLINLQATRCQIGIEQLSTDSLPEAADLQATADMVDRDGWALRCHMAWELRHGELANLCSGAEMLGGEKLTPQGGCVGWTFTFRYPIDGGVLT